jgi:hypothetical protein
VKQKDTVTLTGTGGGATIACGANSNNVFFDTLLATTAASFADDNAVNFLAGEGVVLTHLGDDIIFEANVAGVSFPHPTIVNKPFDVNGTTVNTQPNVTAVKQKETVTLTGTSGSAVITGAGLEARIADWDTGLTETAAAFVTAFDDDYAGVGVVLTSSGADLIFEAAVAGTPFTAPTALNASGDLDGTVAHTTANRIAVKQKDTVTMTGSFGTASMTLAGGLTSEIIGEPTPTLIASIFKAAYETDYLAQGIVLTSSGGDLIFEASVAGVAFTSPLVVLVPGNLAGTVANSQANVTALAQIDTLVVTGTSGTSAVETAGGLTKLITFTTDLATTTGNFVTDHAAAYAAQGIAITSNVANIFFTAMVPGVTFVSPTINAAMTPEVWTNSTILIYDYDIAVTEVENTVGTILWERTGTGTYTGTCEGAFTAEGTWIPAFIAKYYDYLGSFYATLERVSDDVILLSTYGMGEGTTATDGLLTDFPLEFTIFPTEPS